MPLDMEVEANFLAKEDGIVAGIALAEMVFHEVDPSLKVIVCLLHCVWVCWFGFYALVVRFLILC